MNSNEFSGQEIERENHHEHTRTNKNYYELTKEEIKEYKKEFKKFPIYKNNLIQRIIISIYYVFALMSVGTWAVLNRQIEFKDYITAINIPFVILYILFFNIIYYIPIKISFMRWLKIKHNIEYK